MIVPFCLKIFYALKLEINIIHFVTNIVIYILSVETIAFHSSVSSVYIIKFVSLILLLQMSEYSLYSLLYYFNI